MENGEVDDTCISALPNVQSYHNKLNHSEKEANALPVKEPQDIRPMKSIMKTPYISLNISSEVRIVANSSLKLARAVWCINSAG